jgi:hypothetical protein
MDDHVFLAPAQQLQQNCLAFRAKQDEMEGRFQMALAQLEHHRSDTFRSKLKASMLIKDNKLTAKQPLRHELKFMDLMARRDRVRRQHDAAQVWTARLLCPRPFQNPYTALVFTSCVSVHAVQLAQWLGPLSQVVWNHPQPRRPGTPEVYLLDLIKTRINEGVCLDEAELFGHCDTFPRTEVQQRAILSQSAHSAVVIRLTFCVCRACWTCLI